MSNIYTPKAGDAFICVTDSYEEVKLYLTYEKKEDNNKLYAFYYKEAEDGEKSKYIEQPIEQLSGHFYPSFSAYTLRGKQPDGLEQQLKAYQITCTELDKILLNSEGYSTSIKDAIKQITEKTSINDKESSDVIKLLIAEKILYKYRKLKSGEYISFSELKSSSENSKIYYGSLAEEIALKSKQISLLISHGQTVGNYREFILRSLLEKYLPSKYSVVTGFIEGIPRQLDILIIDSANYSPVFKEADLVVARKEAVRAIIEVKTNLNSQTLKESLELVYDISRGGIFKPDLPIFKGIFAFETKYADTSSLATGIKNFYTKPYFEEQLQDEIVRGIDYLYREITAVCVLRKHFVFSQYVHANGDQNGNIIPALYSVSDERGLDIQSAMFIASLFEYLDVDFHAKRSTLKGFSNILRSKTASVKHELYMADNDWIPRLASINEHDRTQPSIKERLKKIRGWFNGEVSTSEYIRNLEK